MPRQSDVLVIGAGAAGLAAAGDLSNAGLSVTILEARKRAGGRIRSVRPRNWPVPVELGAEFVHGQSETVFEIAARAQLLIDRLPTAHLLREGRSWRTISDYWIQVDKAMRGLRRTRQDRSVAEALEASPLSSVRKRVLRAFVEGYHAAPVDRASANALSAAGEEPESPDDRAQFRLVGGYGGIVAHLLSRLDPSRTRLIPGAAASRVVWSRGRVAVATIGGEVYPARRAIVTVSAGVLNAETSRPCGIQFHPDPTRIRRALSRIAMAQVVKIVLRFEAHAWKRDIRPALQRLPVAGAAFLQSPDAAFPTWWTAAPGELPQLTAWAGGPAAAALARATARERIGSALATLEDFGLGKANRLARALLSVHAEDWNRPASRGAYSYLLVGGETAPRRLAQPVEDTLFFAGEATSSDQSGTVPGAIETGRRAARQVLRRAKG